MFLIVSMCITHILGAMDLILIESLVAVAETGTITHAAERLSVSQSALSRRLQQLEADLGAELLARGRNGAELTAIGRDVVADGRVLLAQEVELRQRVAEHLGLARGTVRIGGGATVTSFLLPGRIAELQRRHPGVRFEVKEAASREVALAVAAGELELGVVTLPVPSGGLDVRELFEDRIVLVAPEGHPLARRRRPILLTELEGSSLVGFEASSAIRQIIDGALRHAGVHVDVVMELRSIPSILRMVAETGHLAFVSRLSLSGQPGVRAVAVRGLSISRTLAVVTRHGVSLSRAAGAFAELL